MKLSRLYCNHPEIFEPLSFNDGLNVVLAEIRLEDNRDKDTHNLGKSTLGLLLDFCLLSRKNDSLFLFKHEDTFTDFVFFLEIHNGAGTYITVKRGVKNASKISFKRHSFPGQDFTELPEDEWDHSNMSFEKSKRILDGFLDFNDSDPWSYRKSLGYFLRTQKDYSDVFELSRFSPKHADWKPYLAQILGLNGKLVKELYDQEILIKRQQDEMKTIQSFSGNSDMNLEQVEGILFLKNEEKLELQEELDQFDFWGQDKLKTEELVDKIDCAIAELNEERYSLSHSEKKIQSSLKEDHIAFEPTRVEQLFHEAGVNLGEQIKQDYEQLIAFNTAITKERRDYLQEELREVEDRIQEINRELKDLSEQRSYILSFLSETDIVQKYKKASNGLVNLKADIERLTEQRNNLKSLAKLSQEARTAQETKTRLADELRREVNGKADMNGDHIHANIRKYFSKIVREILDVRGLLTVSLNTQDHLEFSAEILDEQENSTSAQRGYSYQKVLCIAFDLAVLRAHLGSKFPSFVFHDGALESLDRRKKDNLIEVMRTYANLGVQQIVTVIDTDLPARTDNQPVFSGEEIMLRLHDEGPSGRLFKMDSW